MRVALCPHQQKDLEWQKLAHADETMAGKHRRLCKSRYDSISCYLSESPMMKDAYNDIPLPLDEETLATLQEAGASDGRWGGGYCVVRVARCSPHG